MALAKEYTTDKIRNVAVLGHGGAGRVLRRYSVRAMLFRYLVE